MTRLRDELIGETLASVDVLYVTRVVSLWWKDTYPERKPVFCGWYWVRGAEELGPFRTRSSAMLDAWYRHVKGEAPPRVWTPADMPRSVSRSAPAYVHVTRDGQKFGGKRKRERRIAP